MLGKHGSRPTVAIPLVSVGKHRASIRDVVKAINPKKVIPDPWKSSRVVWRGYKDLKDEALVLRRKKSIKIDLAMSSSGRR